MEGLKKLIEQQQGTLKLLTSLSTNEQRLPGFDRKALMEIALTNAIVAKEILTLIVTVEEARQAKNHEPS